MPEPCCDVAGNRRRRTTADDVELPWCCSIARRCLADHRRGTVRRRLVDRLTGPREPATNGADDPASVVDDAHPALHAALALLSADDRELLTLWAWELVVNAPEGVEALIGGIAFEMGGQYLISADAEGNVEGNVAYCGYTAPATDDMRASFEQAFPA